MNNRRQGRGKSSLPFIADCKAIGKRMQEVRIDRKMTQQEMADALFISANTLKSKQGGGDVSANTIRAYIGHLEDALKRNLQKNRFLK